MPSIESLTFDTTGLKAAQTDPTRKVWFTPDGDGISRNCSASRCRDVP